MSDLLKDMGFVQPEIYLRLKSIIHFEKYQLITASVPSDGQGIVRETRPSKADCSFLEDVVFGAGQAFSVGRISDRILLPDFFPDFELATILNAHGISVGDWEFST